MIDEKHNYIFNEYAREPVIKSAPSSTTPITSYVMFIPTSS